MDADLLAGYRRFLSYKLPLIGGWLWREAVKALTLDGTPQAVQVLVEAAARNGNEREQFELVEALQRLAEQHNIEAQEALCTLVITHDLAVAREAAIKTQCAPCDAHQRALFYFLTEQWEKYESLDFDHTFLRTAYEISDDQLRRRITQQARQAGRVEWVEVVIGERRKRRLGKMTDEEWNSALAILFAGQKWEKLWRLARGAPRHWSARILQRMNESGWVLSKEDEQRECEQLIQLAMGWKRADLSSLIYCQATLEGLPCGIESLIVSTDGRLLASGCSDKTVRLWGLPDGTLLQVLQEHTRSFAISPDSRLLASLSFDNDKIRLWSLPGGMLLQTFPVGKGTNRRIVISPDSQILYTMYGYSEIGLWSLPEGILQRFSNE